MNPCNGGKMKIYFQTAVIKAILQQPESQAQGLKASFKGRTVEIRSEYWDPCLTLIFTQHSHNHFEGYYWCEKQENGEMVFDMPINIDVEIGKKSGKYYDWYQHYGFKQGQTTLFDHPEDLLEQAMFQYLRQPIEQGKTLCPIKWYTKGGMSAEFQICPKYQLTANKIKVDNRTLHQIQLMRSIPRYDLVMGELGGYVEHEKNLSFEGDCWLEASRRGYFPIAYGNAKVTENARLFGQVIINGNAEISGNANIHAAKSWKITVTDNARVSENAFIRNKFCDCDLYIGNNLSVTEDLEHKLLRNHQLVNLYQQNKE